MKRISRFLESFEDWSSGILLAAGMFILFYEVILRYVLKLPTTWQDEIARMLVIWGVFIGAAATLRDNNHIQIDLLYNVLPKPLKKLVDVLVNVVILGFFVFLFVSGLELVMRRLETGQASLNGVPLWIVYFILPFSSLLLSIRSIERIVRVFRKAPDGSSDGHGSEVNIEKGF